MKSNKNNRKLNSLSRFSLYQLISLRKQSKIKNKFDDISPASSALPYFFNRAIRRIKIRARSRDPPSSKLSYCMVFNKRLENHSFLSIFLILNNKVKQLELLNLYRIVTIAD